VFRLQYVHGEALTVAKVMPYVGSALFTAGVLAAILVCHAWGSYRAVIAGTLATIVLLVIYKIAVPG
jgi:glucose uptake protein GlcU